MAKAFIVPAYYQLLFLGNCIYLQKGIFPQNKIYIEYQTKMKFKPKSLLNIVFIVLFYVYIILHHMETNIIVYTMYEKGSFKYKIFVYLNSYFIHEMLI